LCLLPAEGADHPASARSASLAKGRRRQPVTSPCRGGGEFQSRQWSDS
jgi:hypothetical protein